MKSSDKVPTTERFMWICNTLFHQTFAVVTIYIFWVIFYNFDLKSQTTQHAILSTLAYLPLMGEAIILFSTDNVWSKYMERSTKYWIHGLTLFISCVLLTAGIAIMVERNSGAHFTSNHGLTGFISWVFILLSQVLGIAAAKTQLFGEYIRPIYVKFVHNIFGVLGYIFGIVSLCYGLETRSFSRNSTDESRMASFCLLGITTAWCILGGLKSAVAQIRTIFT